MSDFYSNPGDFRQTDGPFAKQWYRSLDLINWREPATNDITAIATVVGGVLTKDTTPNLEYTNGDTDSALRLQWAASNVDPLVYQFCLPPDNDTGQPIYVDFLCKMGGTADTPVLSLDTFFDTGDTKVEDDTTALGGTAAHIVTATIAAADVPINAFTMSLEVTPGAHGTDTLEVYGIRVRGTRL